MSTTASKTHLKRRVDDYIWRDRSPPLMALRKLLREEFIEMGDVAIIGGLLRDVARRGARSFSSDIDLVINAPPSKVARLAQRLDATPNRFGGYGANFPLWKVDFWALRNTWAHTEGHVTVESLSDLTKTTFFNFDAIVYVINTRKIVAPDRYIDTILSNTLDVNLLPNPSIDGNMVRAIRRVLGWHLKMGKELRLFVEENLDSAMHRHVVETEMSLYGQSMAARYKDHIELIEALIKGRGRTPAYYNNSIQYELPL